MKTPTIFKAFIGYLMILFCASAFAQTMLSDSEVTARIKTKVALSSSLSVFNVGVTTNNGIVTLTGSVDSPEEAGEFIELVQSVPGVKDIDTSQLIVKESSNQLISDSVITAKVKGKFIQEKLFGDKDIAAMNIKVETSNGVVYLTGYADNREQAKNAVVVAKTVKGVKKIVSRIRVKN